MSVDDGRTVPGKPVARGGEAGVAPAGESDRAIHTLLSPHRLADFMEDYRERRHLWIRRTDRDFFADLLSLEDLDDHLTSGRLREGDLRIADYEGLVVASDYLRPSAAGSARVVDPEGALRLFADGATLIFNALDRAHGPLHGFCRALEGAFCCRIQANVYLSPAGHQGFAPHFDTHDVFLLQVAGQKIWKLYGSPVELPRRGETLASRDLAVGEPSAEFTLHQGEALYLPRGLVHEGRATSSTSCHITIGFHTATVAALLRESLDELVGEERECRASLPVAALRDGSVEPLDLDALASFVARLVDRKRVEGCLARIRDRLLEHQPVRLHRQLIAISKLADLSLDSRVTLRDGVRFSLERCRVGGEGGSTHECVRISLPRKSIEFPLYVESSLRALVGSGRCRVRDIEGDLDDRGKLVLVRRLVSENVLTIENSD